MPTPDKRRRRLAAAGLSALVLGGIVLVHERQDGPVLVKVEPGIAVSAPNDVGHDTTYGDLALVAPGGQQATLLHARLVPTGSTQGMHVLDVVAAEPSRGFVRVSSGQGFPSTPLEGKTRPLAGAPVPRPGDKDWTLGVELVFRLRADRSGLWSFSGIDVAYEVGGNREHEFVPGPFTFCAPLTADCPTQPPASSAPLG